MGLRKISSTFVEVSQKIEDFLLVEVLFELFELGERFEELFGRNEFDGEFGLVKFSLDFWIEDEKCSWNEGFEDYSALVSGAGAYPDEDGELVVAFLYGVLLQKNVIELGNSLIGKFLTLYAEGFDFFEVEVGLLAIGVGDGQFAVDHEELLILLEEVEVAFLEFDC